jgi:Rrf2 family protein
MLVTRETDYALRILRALNDGKLRSIQEISEMENTPKPFAYRIIKKLEHLGWISISRGAEGGCRLIVDLHDVNLLQLLEGMGMDTKVSECLALGYSCTRKEVCDDTCKMKPVLAQIQKVMDSELERRSIWSMVRGE